MTVRVSEPAIIIDLSGVPLRYFRKPPTEREES